MSKEAERHALLQRIEELTYAPTLVHMIDHYVGRLVELDRAD